MQLICRPLMNGIMAVWTEVKDAARYHISLYINEQMISKRTNERTEMYCSFTNLAAVDGQTSSLIASCTGCGVCGRYSGCDYYVQVEAENRQGEIIGKSAKLQCKIREF